VIVDDICDGGRTFLEIAKTIRSERKYIFGDKFI
jgi:phosphoribosylpyrophosphate synthetase